MIRRLNHAVLWVRDAQRSAEFYTTVLGFEAVATMGSQAVFLRADGSTNDHDLGLFTVGNRPQPACAIARSVPPGLAGQHHRGSRSVARQVGRRWVAAGRERPRRQQEPVRGRSRRHRVRSDVGRSEGELAHWTIDRTTRSRCRARSLGSGRYRRSITVTSDAARRATRRRAWRAGTRSHCVATRLAARVDRRATGNPTISRPNNSFGPNVGTGNTAGRCSTLASVAVNSMLVTGFGAVRLTAPQISDVSRWTMAPTSSSIDIQLCH